MSSLPSVVVIDRDPETARITTAAFRDSEIRFASFRDPEEAGLDASHWNLEAIVCDLSNCEFNGFEFLKKIRRTHPGIPFLGISNSTESRSAIEAMKAGAFDFLTKPLDPCELKRSISEAIGCVRKAHAQVTIDPRNESEDNTDTLVGNSRAMLDVYKALGLLSPTPVTVLVRGETGTGKELVARALFQHGHRAHKPFVTVNCAAIPENLLESELFGHEKGSFTGATATRIGKFEQANNATLFLDEIGDLNHSLQAKLLRVLQEKRFQRVGGSTEIAVDARIIAATHRPIERMISEGKFREDLFYRLNVATIKLPPLRNRSGDVPLLVQFFLGRFSRELGLPLVGISRTALSRLESARLPGNVRQLQNLVRKALLRSRGYEIERPLIEELLNETGPDDPDGLADGSENHLADWCHQLVENSVEDSAERGSSDAHRIAMETVESNLIRAAMKKSGGNITNAARWLGLSRLTVREKAKKYGIGS